MVFSVDRMILLLPTAFYVLSVLLKINQANNIYGRFVSDGCDHGPVRFKQFTWFTRRKVGYNALSQETEFTIIWQTMVFTSGYFLYILTSLQQLDMALTVLFIAIFLTMPGFATLSTENQKWPVLLTLMSFSFVISQTVYVMLADVGDSLSPLPLASFASSFAIVSVALILRFPRYARAPVINSQDAYVIDWSVPAGSYKDDRVVVIGREAYHMGGEIDEWSKNEKLKVVQGEGNYKEYLMSRNIADSGAHPLSTLVQRRKQLFGR